ncbi:hypothetical protein QYZ87_01480 [Porphyromonadaceae bacterium W3.11]|nr:hypothetical protein [Porphyromonadaceae bacterium W3.11]
MTVKYQTAEELLDSIYDQVKVGFTLDLKDISQKTILNDIDLIVEKSESRKAVLAVFLTSLVYKILNPQQDIRLHQTDMPEGYSGRSFDTIHISPWLRKHKFPAMSESGWLTRSFEQKSPYTLDYKGAISPRLLKNAFLKCIDHIESTSVSANEKLVLLKYLISKLVILRASSNPTIALPRELSIDQIVSLLRQHFEYSYSGQGAARLPTLAFYAIYKVLISEAKRFDGKELLPLEKHTSSDRQSGRMGDIDIVNSYDSTPFEAVEIKYGIPITVDLIDIAYEKFQGTKIDRYYLLSTSDVDSAECNEIMQKIIDIKRVHGCQVIVNGVYNSLRYYLRLIVDTSAFIQYYTEQLSIDEAIRFDHKEAWNNLVKNL